MLLLCSLLKLKQLFKEKNGLPTSLHFFFENAKNLSRSDDAKRIKKQRMPLREKKYQGRDYIDVIFVSFKSLRYGRYKYREIALIHRK